jgi:acyl-CoA synthetase (NDP forming)
MSLSPIEAMLRARSVAVVGASERADAFGTVVLRQIVDGGYSGAVLPVNPRYDLIDGLPCFPSIAAIPQAVDCAILAVGNERLEAALSDAASAGARSAVIFGTAHVVAADGRRPLTVRLAEIARESGMALCGANGMGFFSFRDRLLVTGFPYGLEITAGAVGFISHSGSTFSAIVKNRRGLRFNYAISGGQELVTTAADYLQFLVEQPETRVVGCFLETIRDPAGFVAALKAAAARDVPVVVLKVGRTERGRQLAQAHSGAITGVDATYQALFERHNVVRVDSLDEMLDTLELLTSPRRPATGALALAGDSGGERGLIVDVAADLDLPFADLAPETTARLQQTLEPELLPVNPLDLWASGRDFETVYERCLRILADDPATGMTVFAVDLPTASRLLPAYVAIAERVQAATDKPFAVLGNAATSVEPTAATALRSAGIPVLMGTSTGLAAIRHLLRYQSRRSEPPVVADIPPGLPVHQRAIWRRRLDDAIGGALADRESKSLLAAYGIPVTDTRKAGSAAAAARVATVLGFPVVLKTAMPGLLHKSDRGGVILHLRSRNAVRRAYRRLAEAFGPVVTVEPQIESRDSVEFYLGMVNDEQFGPVVTIGFGGIFVEILRDTVSFLPPLGADEARRMLRRLRGYPLLDGARGRPPVDLTTLARAIADFSVLCHQLGDVVAEIDVNPLLARPDGAIAVDALVVPKTPRPGDRPITAWAGRTTGAT